MNIVRDTDTDRDTGKDMEMNNFNGQPTRK
jgi:hypothetical protein